MRREPIDSRPHASTHGTATKPIPLPPTVYVQLDAIRRTGDVDMHTHLPIALQRCGFDEAFDWIRRHSEQYARGLTAGFEPAEGDLPLEITPDHVTQILSAHTSSSTSRDDASTDAQRRLLAYLDKGRHLCPIVDHYYAESSWRTTAPLSTTDHEAIDTIQRTIDCLPQSCYYNAQMAAITYGETKQLSYVEGYAMSDAMTIPVQHAWIERDETVIELTFPEGPAPGSDAAYFGTEFPLAAVREQILETGQANPLVG